MSIYMLKLEFLGGLLMILGHAQGLWAGPHQSMMLWALKMN